jgi:hypothetical protein
MHFTLITIMTTINTITAVDQQVVTDTVSQPEETQNATVTTAASTADPRHVTVSSGQLLSATTSLGGRTVIPSNPGGEENDSVDSSDGTHSDGDEAVQLDEAARATAEAKVDALVAEANAHVAEAFENIEAIATAHGAEALEKIWAVVIEHFAKALENVEAATVLRLKSARSDCETAKTAEDEIKAAEKSAIAEIAAKYVACFKLIFEDVKNGTAPETAGAQQIVGLAQLARNFGTDVENAKKDAKAKLEILAAENADKSSGEGTE